MTPPLFLVIGGGSFQGKSLAALHTACRLRIPAIVCTDTVRNVLGTMQPDATWLGTSTYLLSPKDLRRQMDAVSTAVLGSLDIFRVRGERCIVEGMHLTPEAIERLAESQDALLLCLDNQVAFDRRIGTKSTTRSRLNTDLYNEYRERIRRVPRRTTYQRVPQIVVRRVVVERQLRLRI
jgi:2-phosphoglycerate kinase